VIEVAPRPGVLRVATWNVNSLNARLERLEQWLETVQPDICCLQETKLTDERFPAGRLAALGYESVHHGTGQWNGVAILSRVGIKDASVGRSAIEAPGEARLVAASCGGIEVHSVYVPNGRALDSPHFGAKLEFMDRLSDLLAQRLKTSAPVLACGDFNVAPEDRDVYDPAQFVGATHVSPAERAALQRLVALGFVDCDRRRHPEVGNRFTWWDYRGGAFHRDLGMRIDLVLASPELASALGEAWVDRDARRGQGSAHPPSDHAPLVVDFDRTLLDPAGTIGPASG
jgi:exodeoxyribonuclease-3